VIDTGAAAVVTRGHRLVGGRPAGGLSGRDDTAVTRGERRAPIWADLLAAATARALQLADA
jgi:hypothetical protein